MLNHRALARLFLIGLGTIGLYTAASEIPLEGVALIPCVFHAVTDVPCLGCGMTRACLALIHGHFADAWRYHPFSFLIIGLVVGVAFFPIWLKNAWTRCAPRTRNVIAIGGIVLCLFVWIHKLSV